MAAVKAYQALVLQHLYQMLNEGSRAAKICLDYLMSSALVMVTLFSWFITSIFLGLYVRPLKELYANVSFLDNEFRHKFSEEWASFLISAAWSTVVWYSIYLEVRNWLDKSRQAEGTHPPKNPDEHMPYEPQATSPSWCHWLPSWCPTRSTRVNNYQNDSPHGGKVSKKRYEQPK